MLEKILVTIFCIIASSGAYRAGGLGDGGRTRWPNLPKWFFDTKVRDMGCALIALGWMILFYPTVAWWVNFISFGLMFGALTTYWDKIFKFDNFWVHGFMVALAYFPYAMASGDWLGFGSRCISLAILMGIVSDMSGNDYVEEFGRGGAIALTLPLLLI